MTREKSCGIFWSEMTIERRPAKTPKKESFLSRIGRAISGAPTVEEYRARVDAALEECIQTEVIPDLKEKGLLGKHKLEVPVGQRGTHGDLAGRVIGRFFLFAGWIEGQIEGETVTESQIQFAWRTNNENRELIISEIPISEFVFEIDEEAETPTIEFDFNLFRFTRKALQEEAFHPKFAGRSFPHPNDYLKPKILNRVTLTLTQETYNALPLPKVGQSPATS